MTLTDVTGAGRQTDLCGMLAIDKPRGMTSHDVVSRVRRLVGMKRVGHGGTLDPFATGVLIVAVGRATRLLQYVQNGNKSYHSGIVLGVSTDTADVDGKVVSRSEAHSWPDLTTVMGVLENFTGEIHQVPPAYSAIKIGGRKLYEMARSGEIVDVPARKVTVHAIELLDYSPPELNVLVHCSKGTYIRSIARDIGTALGVGAYCHSLRRIRNGPFCISECWTLDELAAADIRGNWPQIARHPDAAVSHLDALVLGKEDTLSWYHGRPVHITARHERHDDALLRVYDDVGQFLGVGATVSRLIVRPKVVLPSFDEDAHE